MEFTIEAYADFLSLICETGYVISNYHNWREEKRTIILRHDVDMNIEVACEMAMLEKSNNVQSTYFILVNTDMYNVFSAKSKKLMKKILECQCEIGLHFDEKPYQSLNKIEIENAIRKEKEILEKVIEEPVRCVSWHRPSQMILEQGVQIEGLINSYDKEYFSSMKYVSDSRRNWREDVCDLVESETYARMHILTHPVWYSKNYEKGIKEALVREMTRGVQQHYKRLDENIRDFQDIISKNELERMLKIWKDRWLD